ncbi:MAG: hypothetical protein JXB14_06325 [Candidatus Altiarchaeota archaeon]|nr:hypothetical protein [Candidatus Altiarchaeota archaeon]
MALPGDTKKPQETQPEKTSKAKEDEKVLIAAVILIIIALFAGSAIVIYALQSSAPKCPPSCDDGNPCTNDECKEGEGLCFHKPLDGSYGMCSGNSDKCRVRTCVFGSCKEELIEDCCGNRRCEEGETYMKCAEDCEPPENESECKNHLDDDFDGLIDCADPDCRCIENCTDGINNDADGLIDCEDPDCICVENKTEICDNREDDDGDGLRDCCDSDCRGNGECDEDCNDNRDNDCDGKTDCFDSDCSEDWDCVDCEYFTDKHPMIARFQDEFSALTIESWSDECEAVPGEFIRRTNEVGCDTTATDPFYFNCTEVEATPFIMEITEFCEEELKAEWVCQTNYIGCLCNKNPPDEPGEEQEVWCEDAPVDSARDWFDCTLYSCQNDGECYWNSDVGGCACQDPKACGWHLEDPINADSEYCGGECPGDEYCSIVTDLNVERCKCIFVSPGWLL